jgi:hypothetical protein
MGEHFVRSVLIAVFLAMVALTLSSFAKTAASPAMSLVVDESQAPRKLAFVHERIQVQPGPHEVEHAYIPRFRGPKEYHDRYKNPN